VDTAGAIAPAHGLRRFDGAAGLVEGGDMEQQSTWERLAPLTGLVFVAIVVAVFAIGGETPDQHDTAQEVQAFYGAHHDKHEILSYILAFSMPFLLFFASILRHDLRKRGGTGQLANAAFGGGVVATVGFGILAMVHLALAVAADSANTIGTTQVLNVLDSNDFLPMAAGMGVLVLAAGWSSLRHGGMPRWLAWVGIVIGIAIFTPAGFIGFLASGLWVAIVSILLTRARQSAAPPPAA
jgi:Domain of unknown function (DUF4386)